MQINKSLFCSLATSPRWQSWLYNYNQEIYRQFITKLQSSAGCAENTRIMQQLLDQIINRGGYSLLMGFLSRQFPHVIDKAAKPIQKRTMVFEDYVAGLLTYPHRKIIESDNVEADVLQFIRDKGKSDYVIVDGVGFVEYLEKSEVDLPVPPENWQIHKYKHAHK